MNHIQEGFSLIELMTVVAVVGILSATALPTYQDYTIRGRVSEAAAAAGACKTSVAEYYSSAAVMPANVNQAGCAGTTAATQFVASTDVTSGGVITVTMTDDVQLGAAAHGSLTLTPQVAAGNTIGTWSCSGTPQKYMPGGCR